VVQDLKVQGLVKLVDGFKELVKSFEWSYSIKYDAFIVLYSSLDSFFSLCVVLILFVLQRGTGLSTPLTCSSMLQFKSAKELADYLVHFRADNIVKDAEFIRVRLVPKADPWTILGQVICLCIVYWSSCFSSCHLILYSSFFLQIYRVSVAFVHLHI